MGRYGQGGPACCDSWSRKESDTTEWLNWTDICPKWQKIKTHKPDYTSEEHVKKNDRVTYTDSMCLRQSRVNKLQVPPHHPRSSPSTPLGSIRGREWKAAFSRCRLLQMPTFLGQDESQLSNFKTTLQGVSECKSSKAIINR